MKICVTGFYGWNCLGDEGILLAIIDSLGWDNEYIVCTTLPFNLAEEYLWRLPRTVVDEVRSVHDLRMDYDAFILGGGGLFWGYGWPQALNAFAHEKPSMNYGVGYQSRYRYSPRLKGVYREFLANFDAITVRNEESLKLLSEMGVEATLSMCPSINLKEEKFDGCPEGMIAICPRYEDFLSNEPQIEWIVESFKDSRSEVLLVPFGPYNKQGVEVDLALCKEVSKRMGGARILEASGYEPRRVKYALSRSRLVVSGGRYHAVLWAIAHNVPYKVYPEAPANYPKIGALMDMHEKYGSEKLREMEKRNREAFMKVIEGRLRE